MKKGNFRARKRKGFILMEVMIALTVFSMVGVSYMVALNEIAEILREMRRDSKMGQDEARNRGSKTRGLKESRARGARPKILVCIINI